jgi:hypothetical protein
MKVCSGSHLTPTTKLSVITNRPWSGQIFVQDLAQQHLPGLARDPKGITKAQAAILADRYVTAKDSAFALDLMHSANQSASRSNPSTLAYHPPGTAPGPTPDEFQE